jgi:hypothetical protein
MFLDDLDDLDGILQRHRAFWQREIVDRPPVAVTAPIDRPAPLPQARDDEQLLADPEFNVAASLAAVANTWYGGDALPVACSPGNLLYPAWGGSGRFGSQTVWVDPTITDWRQWADYRFDRQNVWVRRYLGVNKAIAQAARGKYFVQTQGFFGAMDAMASMRGYEDFLMELALEEARPAIRAAQAQAIEGHQYIVRSVWDDAADAQEGAVTMPCIWAPGRVNYWSADFTCLIGPRDFDEWMAGEFAEIIRSCEYSFYHLDGPDAVRHLPAIARMPGLHGIQYTRAPREGIDDVIRMAREIQNLGKAAYVWVLHTNAQRVFDELDPRGMFVQVNAPSVQAGKDVLAMAAKWKPRGR